MRGYAAACRGGMRAACLRLLSSPGLPAEVQPAPRERAWALERALAGTDRLLEAMASVPSGTYTVWFDEAGAPRWRAEIDRGRERSPPQHLIHNVSVRQGPGETEALTFWVYDLGHLGGISLGYRVVPPEPEDAGPCQWVPLRDRWWISLCSWG